MTLSQSFSFSLTLLFLSLPKIALKRDLHITFSLQVTVKCLWLLLQFIIILIVVYKF